jgi:hypothetical protein
MKTVCVLAAALLGPAGVAGAGQACDPSYSFSMATERFADNGDGTLTDTQSGLTWMRCALGQSWTGATCSGRPDTFTWHSAQTAAEGLDGRGGYAGRRNWRVPQIPELAMIVERQCADPRTNLALFPATPAGFFWSATVRQGPGMDAEAYALSFGPEGARHHDKEDRHYVRLVRDDQ